MNLKAENHRLKQNQTQEPRRQDALKQVLADLIDGKLDGGEAKKQVEG